MEDLRLIGKREIVEEFVPAVSIRGFEKHISGERHHAALAGFPMPAVRGRANLWVAEDVAAWLSNLRTFCADRTEKEKCAIQNMQKRAPGRPKKLIGGVK